MKKEKKIRRYAGETPPARIEHDGLAKVFLISLCSQPRSLFLLLFFFLFLLLLLLLPPPPPPPPPLPTNDDNQDDDRSIKATDKWLWSQFRALWLFSKLYRRCRDYVPEERAKQWLATAAGIYNFTTQHGWNETAQGWNLCLSGSGSVLRGYER